MTSKNSRKLDLSLLLEQIQGFTPLLELDQFFSHLLPFIIEKTGAKKGIFILKKKNQLQIVAQISAENPERGDFQSIPLEISEKVPHSVVNQVNHTHKIVVSGDLTKKENFKSDSYIVQNQPKSILCKPIIRQSELVGILYIENTLIVNAFSQKHLDFLDLLSPHVAISLLNIQSFEDLRQEIAERKKAENALLKAFNVIKKLKEQLQAEKSYLQEEIKVVHNYEEIVGKSSAVRKVLSKIEQVANTDTTVLIMGETGTGKELFAHAIHNLSPRKERALVKVNCAALPSTIIESELFGHEKGAYTGATSSQIGRFEIADGGTIFLDEISELALELQAKLLRVIQEGQFERLGSSKTLQVNVRIIAATNKDLTDEVKKGIFREDLFYRLNVFPINVPPLRERKEDIPQLVWYFVNEFAKKMGKKIENIPGKSMESLMNYSWSGNVRELKNIIERAMILSTGNTLRVEVPKIVVPSNDYITLEEVERRHIIEILEKTNWRVRGKNGAAELLGLKPTTLDSKMLKLGIKKGSAS